FAVSDRTGASCAVATLYSVSNGTPIGTAVIVGCRSYIKLVAFDVEAPGAAIRGVHTNAISGLELLNSSQTERDSATTATAYELSDARWGRKGDRWNKE